MKYINHQPRRPLNFTVRLVLMLWSWMMLPPINGSAESTGSTEDRAREYLNGILLTRDQVTQWIQRRNRERYDPDIGWIHIEGRSRDGIDGSTSSYHYDPSGARRTIAYRTNPCRINTYGDSFTHCDQVSDGETWQERLATHLCEPVRNFGVSGHSVYQMYIHMKREETRTPARYVIVNIYSDDHYRSLRTWDAIAGGTRPTEPHVVVNAHKGTFEECGNPCPTPESLYNLCDSNWVYEQFKDNFVLMLRTGSGEDLAKLAREHGKRVASGTDPNLGSAISALRTETALYASMRIVGKMEEFAAVHGKKILYVLSFTEYDVVNTVKSGGVRFDQAFVDFMDEKGLPYVDLLEVHLEDFAKFNISIEDYIKRYYIGHYNPLGNMFTAYAIKDKVAEMLDPKPVTYRH
jgi:hypothetical protein